MARKTPKKRPGPGRPPLPDGKARSRRLQIRVTPAEVEKLMAEARRKGVSVSDVVMAPWRRKRGD